MIHYLKTWPDDFNATVLGIKKFELRDNDRKFQRGDILCLRLFNPAPDKQGYCGKHIFVEVRYILTGGKFGLNTGFVAMSIDLLREVPEIDNLAPQNSRRA